MRSLISSSRRVRRHPWRLGAVLAALAAGVLIPTSLTQQGHAASTTTLAPSTFEGGDGDLTITTTGNTDWCNQTLAQLTNLDGSIKACPMPDLAPGLVATSDLPTGKTDNSFGQGTKEDNPSVNVVTGSIPPNKSDLSRFYVAGENAGGHSFMYLAWERLNVLGNANMDFEINQTDLSTTLNSSTTGPVTLGRLAGDRLITFDFGGSGTPDIGLLTWATSTTSPTPPGTANVCYSSSSFPCWANRVDMTLAGEAVAAVNSAQVWDPTVKGAIQGPIPLQAGTFGEAALDLTAAKVFNTNVCTTFSSAFLKSRSSTSFTSEVKDFIAPVTTDITNCSISTAQALVPNDSATVSGVQSSTTGTVSFKLFSPAGWDANSGTCVAGAASTTQPAEPVLTQTLSNQTGPGPFSTTNASDTNALSLYTDGGGNPQHDSVGTWRWLVTYTTGATTITSTCGTENFTIDNGSYD